MHRRRVTSSSSRPRRFRLAHRRSAVSNLCPHRTLFLSTWLRKLAYVPSASSLSWKGRHQTRFVPLSHGVRSSRCSNNLRHPRLRGCNPIPHIPSLRPLLVVPAKAGIQGFQSLAPGSPLTRGRRIVCPQDFLTAACAGTTGNVAYLSIRGGIG